MLKELRLWIGFLPLMVLTLLSTCTPAPATAQTARATSETVEFFGANDVGGAIILMKEAGPCEVNGGKLAVSINKDGDPLWFGCWRDAGGSIQLVWITAQGPKPYLVPKTMLKPGSELKTDSPRDLKHGGTKT